MAINIPIVSEFVDTGVKKAITQFKQLETTGEKAQFAIKKAAVPAAAALGALTAVMGDAVKAAMEDEKSQLRLARQLRITTGANDDQIKSVENYISAQGRNLGITDDKLRPALEGLVRATEDVTKAQDLANLAIDIAAAKGIPLETVTKNLEKAYGGNLTALQKLEPSVRDMIKGGATLEEVTEQLGKTFGGAAEEVSNSAEGGFAKMKIAIDETKESIGASLLPVVKDALPYLQRMADWAQKNPGAFKIIAGTIAAVAVATVALNAAMAVNPFVALAFGVVAIAKAFETLADKVSPRVERIMNMIGSKFFIPQIVTLLDKITGGRFSGDANPQATSTPTRSTVSAIAAGDVSGAMAAAGVEAVSGLGASNATSAAKKATEATKSAVVVPKGPDGYVGPMGLPEISLENLSLAQIDPSIGGGVAAAPDVTINVNGGDPNAVVDALRVYMRQNGSVPITVSPF